MVDSPNTAIPNLELAKLLNQYAGTEPRKSNEPASVCKHKAGSDFLARIKLKTPYRSQIEYAERVKAAPVPDPKMRELS
jgi:hypothetical protein